MKKRVTFASKVRLHAVLCSAAILLSACGGAADTMGNGPSLAANTVAAPAQAGASNTPVNAVPAFTTTDAGQAALAAPAVASAETFAPTQPAAPEQPVNANPADATAATAPVANFDLSGYQTTGAAPEATQAPQ